MPYLTRWGKLRETGWRCWCLLLPGAVFGQSGSWRRRWRSRRGKQGWFPGRGYLQTSLRLKNMKRKTDQHWTMWTFSQSQIQCDPLANLAFKVSQEKELTKICFKRKEIKDICWENLRTGIWCSTPYLNKTGATVQLYAYILLGYFTSPVFIEQHSIDQI